MTEHEPSAAELEQINSKPMINDLRMWAAEYVEKSGGRLALLDYDPDQYEGQHGVSVEGQPMPPKHTDDLAKAAQEHYPALLDSLDNQIMLSKRPVIDTVGSLLDANGNVLLATNHADLIDIAVDQAGVYSRLYMRGFKQFKTGIIISKMIAFLGYDFDGFVVPCVHVLKNVETEIFLSYPRTESAKKHLSQQHTVRGKASIALHNELMKRRLAKFTEMGGVLLALAASGTTDRPSETDPNTIIMSEIGAGTMGIMQQPNTAVAPMAIHYGTDKKIMKFADIPRFMKSDEDCHNAMRSIGRASTDELTGLTVAYAA